MLERHHIIFKSSGGLDFHLNYIYLSPEKHRGESGPHKNRNIDLKYKERLESNLRQLLTKSYYEVDELIERLLLNEKQACKAFKKVERDIEGISRENVIKRLLGGRYYL